ncbi:hypothetical protein FRB94_010206 [Tulasnella sp. JGI-2019a]|nr:hypothetical protein FRB94_010206 [Tulasnella sp. JGI-2019a]
MGLEVCTSVLVPTYRAILGQLVWIPKRGSSRAIQQPCDPPPFCRLPTELLLAIAGNLHIGDLQQLLRVCRATKPVAESRMYQHIVIRWFRRDKIVPLLETLHDRQDLARQVISFEGYLFLDPRVLVRARRESRRSIRFMRWLRGAETVEEQIFSRFSSVLAGALDNMTNLRNLFVYDLWYGISLNAHLMRNAAPRMSLTYLQIGPPFDGLNGPPVASAGRELLFLLREQPLLERLTLPGTHQSLAGQQLLPSDIPSLRCLDGVASDIIKIIPGRPVTSLNVCETADEPATELWGKLNASTQPITRITLHIVRNDLLDLNLKGMVKNLPLLRNLTLIGVRGDKDYEVILANVRLFGSLRSLTVYSPKFDADVLRMLCPNVERVSVVGGGVFYPDYIFCNYCKGNGVFTEAIATHDP